MAQKIPMTALDAAVRDGIDAAEQKMTVEASIGGLFNYLAPRFGSVDSPIRLDRQEGAPSFTVDANKREVLFVRQNAAADSFQIVSTDREGAAKLVKGERPTANTATVNDATSAAGVARHVAFFCRERGGRQA